MTIETYEADTFSLIVTWTLKDGSVKNLVGASVEVYAGNRLTGQKTPLTASVSDGVAGEVRVSAGAFTFPVSLQKIQVIVTKDNVTRTHELLVSVQKSLKEPA